jgi:hypothetical protein
MCWERTDGEELHRNTVETNVRKYMDTFVYFVESELSPKTRNPILLGILPDTMIQVYKGTKCILYNTEQLTRESMRSMIQWTVEELQPLEVWDYSKTNVAILHRLGIHARHVPVQSPKWYLDDLREFRKQGIYYDVGFAGTLTTRRVNILMALEDAGLMVNVIRSFGEERDRELATCSVILNIHADTDYKVFESARCEPWLSIGVPVISETSLDNDPRCIVSDYASFVRTVIQYMEHMRTTFSV